MSDERIIFEEVTAEEKDLVISWRRMSKDQRIMFLLEFLGWIIHERNEQTEIDSAA